MAEEIKKLVEEYRDGKITRREFIQQAVVLTGSLAAATSLIDSLLSPSAHAAQVDPDDPALASEMVQFPGRAGTVYGYVSRPKTSGRYPAIIVVHEWNGLNEHIRDVARRFASEGFVALAPDLLSRAGGTGNTGRRPAGPVDEADESGRTAGDVTEAIASLPLYGVIDDLKAGFEFLEKQPAVDALHISSVGFCWGGWRSFTLATTLPRLSKAVIFYGSSPDSGFERVQASVLAHYAEADTRITGNALWTKKMMDSAGRKFQYYVYSKTDHAFFNDTGNRYNAEASKLAWQRTLDFLRS